MRYFEGATEHVNDQTGGYVMLGDVRSIHHARMFKLREMERLGRTPEQARKESYEATVNDKDRTYDYRAFHMIHKAGMFSERICAAEVQIKLGAEDSEFTGYRMDVTYHCLPANAAPVTTQAEIVVASDFSKVDATAATAESVVAAMKDAMKDASPSNTKVYTASNIPNQRLWADHLLGSAEKDDAKLADEGGVKPDTLRKQMEAAFPEWHIVISWSRETGLGQRWSDEELASTRIASMDLYALPKAPYNNKIAGLNAISNYILDIHAAELQHYVADKAACAANLEKFISEIPSVKQTGEASGMKAEDAETAAVACLEKKDFQGAVNLLIASSLSICPEHLKQEIESSRATTYQDLGGNSFMGMKLIGRMRETLGNGSTVFTLLAESLEAFIKESVKALKSGETGAGQDRCYVRKETEGTNGTVAENAPHVVFFPSGGASPKAFANTATEVFKMFGAQREGGVTLIAQLPGREERSDEDNTTDWRGLIDNMTTSLARHLKLDEKRCGAPVVMAGDSLGALLVWEVVHELNKRFGFLPKHVIVSGNPSPELSSGQWGFGSVASCSIHDCTDEQVIEFLNHGQVRGSGESFEFTEDEKDIVDALRSDCIMFEDFKRDASYKVLQTSATVVRGGADPLTLPSDMEGWKNEFASSKDIVITGAGHQVYSEAGEEMSRHLAAGLGLTV
mmetsp:Transcript_15334/g.23872  ORF Transcript_15334/g.23872 Transcript_15334/m.23872 type:complete len:683 (+) Transcript_15334:2-2050(+)